MRSNYFAYILFTCVLILCFLFLPSFYLSNTVAVCISLVSITKFIKKVSLTFLTVIVLALTVVFPIIILYRIAHSLGTNLDMKTLTSFENILSFVLPTVILIIIVTSAKRTFKNRI